MYRSWVEAKGIYHHFPILLQLELKDKKPEIPFKFNLGWLEDEEF